MTTVCRQHPLSFNISVDDIPCHQNLTILQRQCSLLSTWSTCSRRLLFLRRKGKHGFKCEFGWAVFNFPCKLLLNNDPHDISCIFHIFLYLNHGVNEYHTLSLICNNLPINRTSKKHEIAMATYTWKENLTVKRKRACQKNYFLDFEMNKNQIRAIVKEGKKVKETIKWPLMTLIDLKII